MIIIHQNVLYIEYIQYIVGWMKNGETTILASLTSLQNVWQPILICPEINTITFSYAV